MIENPALHSHFDLSCYHGALFILYLQRKKKKSNLIPRIGACRRFALASMRNVMSGILLAAGPVSTRITVKNLSPAFNLAVNKTKFLAAAKQLEVANLGNLMLLEDISRTTHVFIKRHPVEVEGILLQPCNQDLCTPIEYAQRFSAYAPTTITDHMKKCLVKRGLVPPDAFKEEQSVSVPLPLFSPQQEHQILEQQQLLQQQELQQQIELGNVKSGDS